MPKVGGEKSSEERGRQVEIKKKRAITLGIFSSKGGVGKTTTAANLGSFLAGRFPEDVLVVDANLSAPNLGLHLGMINSEPTIHDVLAGEAPIGDAVHDCGNGLHAVLGSIGFDEPVHLVDLKETLKPLKRKYKIMILDSSPGFGPEVISAIKACTEILVVTNPEIPTIASTLRTFKTAERYKVPIKGVVLNKVSEKPHEIPVSEVEDRLDWPVISVVPDDDKVKESLTEGSPIARYEPDADAAEKFEELADWEYERLSS